MLDCIIALPCAALNPSPKESYGPQTESVELNSLSGGELGSNSSSSADSGWTSGWVQASMQGCGWSFAIVCSLWLLCSVRQICRIQLFLWVNVDVVVNRLCLHVLLISLKRCVIACRMPNSLEMQDRIGVQECRCICCRFLCTGRWGNPCNNIEGYAQESCA